ncbi:hypothetical protein [Salinigranum sp. GCM10025319]|uniref:hypothetical protein n=1 Tax=Salinigranum sp. GCM10025319 TaxID=3252687 RepID=UPI00361B47B3
MTKRMDEIEHTHPHTGEAFGANGGVFARGPAAADGGTEDETMRDVEHEAPDGDGASEVWERGPATETPDRDDDTEAPDADAEETDAEPSESVENDADPEDATDGDKASGEVAVEKDTDR